MKKLLLVCAGWLSVNSLVLADNWDLAQDSIRLGVAEVDRTVSEIYQGKKLLLGTHYCNAPLMQACSICD